MARNFDLSKESFAVRESDFKRTVLGYPSQEKGSDPLTLASVRDGFGSWPIYQFEEAY